MRQRAAIALALACEPKVLLADEPTTALDVMVQAQILELLVRLTRDLGLSMILVTHDLPVVAQVCDRAAVMYAGEIVEMGAMSSIYHDPRHPYTRMLFGATPDLLGDAEVVSIPGAPPRLDREIVGLPVRAPLRLRLRAVRDGRPAPAGDVARPRGGLPSQRPRGREGAGMSTTAEPGPLLEVDDLVTRYPVSRGRGGRR